jgi:EAL domain-containing protein (putative c-di-GMP-specific phosphodiesterase class I)
MLADAELPAESLEIELTESVAFGDPALFPALEALRQIGVRFAPMTSGRSIPACNT